MSLFQRRLQRSPAFVIIPCVCVRAAFDQYFNSLDVPISRRETQRRPMVLLPRIDIRVEETGVIPIEGTRGWPARSAPRADALKSIGSYSYLPIDRQCECERWRCKTIFSSTSYMEVLFRTLSINSQVPPSVSRISGSSTNV